MAGSGWCHHPLRKTTSELLIMVRRNELACRDQWSHSLWEEGVWQPTAAPFAPVDVEDPSVAGRPLLPATEHDIAALLRAERAERPLTPSVLPQEDVVLGEARLVTDRTPPWRRDEPVEEPRRDYDPRTAIKRAREAYRERMRAQEAERAALAEAAPLAIDRHDDLADPSSLGADETNPLDGAVPGDDAPDVDPVAPARVEPERAIQAETETDPVSVSRVADDAAIDSSLDEDAAIAADEVEDREADWWATVEDEPNAPFAEWAEPEPEEAWTTAEPEPVVGVAMEDTPARGTSMAGWFREASAPPAAGAVASSPWSVASATATAPIDDRLGDEPDAWRGDAGWTEVEDAGGAPVSWWDGEPGSEAQPTDELASEYDEAEIDVAPDEVLGVEHTGARDAAVESPPARPVIQLLPVGAVAPGVPRICRTCRDYRPAEGGDRGWCANEWAFTARQMVHPDDPAPCESSAGSWWLPTDDLCLADADVSTHGQPTPHLDRWLPHHRERVAERKRS